MLVFLLILLLAGLGGFGYWAYTQGYLRSLPFLKFGSDNTTATTSSTTGPKDTTAPVIKDIKISATGTDGFCVTWGTDDNSSSQVEYGPKGSSTSKTDVTDAPSKTSMGVVAHGVCIKGLSASTEYQYRVISKNKDGLETISDVNYVSTPAKE
jgi:hypothetical protein